MLKIGIVIADADEYKPLAERVKEKAKITMIAGRRADVFLAEAQGKTAEVTAVLCGIGKVNAAVAATALAENGADIILNYGLSGGVSGVVRNDIVLPSRFLEHDFDLTGIGYKPCQKPAQDYIYFADKQLTHIVSTVFETTKSGTAATGDCFVQSDEKRDMLKSEFSATSCDMETAAIAYVCATYGIKFASIRKISDDAGNDAGVLYREINGLSQADVIDKLLTAIDQIVQKIA